MKPSQYKLIIKSPEGVKRVTVIDPLWLRCQKRVNQPGELIFTLKGNHAAISYLENRCIIELWRRNTDAKLSWYCEGRFIYLCQEKYYYPGKMANEEARSVEEARERVNARFTARCLGALWLLSTRVVAYPKNWSNLSIFEAVSGKYIAEKVVDTNCGPNATYAINRRLREGTISGLTVGVLYQTGDYYLECSGQNVLELLQFIADLEEADFNLVYADAGGWQFRFYDETAGMGTDRRGTVRFSLSFDNIGMPRYVNDCRREKTVGIVAGTETAAGIPYAIVYSANYSPTHDQEVFIDENDIEVLDLLRFAGESELNLYQRIEKIDFDILQTPGLFYGRDYFLGDLVTGRWEDIDLEMKIIGIDIELENNGSDRIKVRTKRISANANA